MDQDEGDNLVWSGSNWIIHGASGVIGQVLKQLVYDELMLERLQRLDTKVKVAHIVLHSLVQLATLTKVGETGAKHAAVRPSVSRGVIAFSSPSLPKDIVGCTGMRRKHGASVTPSTRTGAT